MIEISEFYAVRISKETSYKYKFKYLDIIFINIHIFKLSIFAKYLIVLTFRQKCVLTFLLVFN